jgi:hypothetical protein
MIDLPDTGLILPDDYLKEPAVGAGVHKPQPIPARKPSPLAKCHYSTQSRRSVVGNQPYNAYAPRMQFLQLREVQAHRSVLAALEESNKEQCNDKEQMHATTGVVEMDNTEHAKDRELTTTKDHEIAVWGYLMMQYNLKAGLQRFGDEGAKAEVSEPTQLHMMDTWSMMDPSQLSKEDRAKALSSLLFLKEKRCVCVCVSDLWLRLGYCKCMRYQSLVPSR